MGKTFRLLIACGSGIATSTVIAKKVQEMCENNGFKVLVEQTSVTQVATKASSYDLVVASTKIPNAVMTPYVSGISYLTGIGTDKTDQEIIDKLKALEAQDQ